ncbi:547_t:CDS:2, partial [Racocetra persica]
MLDKIIIWIQELQYYLEDIYRLFEDELVDAKHELNAIDFENFCEALRTRIESALDRFVKWIEVWVHLPLSICRLELSYIQILKEDLSNERSTTFGLLEALR